MTLTYATAVGRAEALDLDPQTILSCVVPNPDDVRHADDRFNLDPATEALFERAFRTSIRSLSRRDKAVIAPITGHVAESLAAVLLDDWGYAIVWQLEAGGRHGVDLIVMAPDDGRLLAVEVKGTLIGGRWPRMSRRALVQMSQEWIDKPDNPGMRDWDLGSGDVYGLIVLVNLADRRLKAVFTEDFVSFVPGVVTDGVLVPDDGVVR